MSSEFFGGKLHLARTFRGLTQAQVAEQVGVSNVVISNYESGRRALLSPILIEALSEVLGFRSGFFLKPIEDPFLEDQCSFRKRAATPEKAKHRARSHGTLVGMVVQYLASRMRLPSYDIPRVPVDTEHDVELAAEKCRAHWGLGSDRPIQHMGRVLEGKAGVVLVKHHAQNTAIDAFSRRGRTTLVSLNPAKRSPSRCIFDMAHELGHLVMHEGVKPGSPHTEKQADRFASAFLLARKGFIRDFSSIRAFSWDHIFELKHRWKTSAAAILYRSYTLRLIDAAQYQRAFKYLSSKGWRKGEPNEPEDQVPELLPTALEFLKTQLGEEPEELSQNLDFKLDTLEDVIGLPLPTPTKDPEGLVRLDSYRR